jgi:hypothetical protein
MLILRKLQREEILLCRKVSVANNLESILKEAIESVKTGITAVVEAVVEAVVVAGH